MDKITNFWQTSWSYKGVQKRPGQKRSGHKKVFKRITKLVLKYVDALLYSHDIS